MEAEYGIIGKTDLILIPFDYNSYAFANPF
jgi:hypothetical protein